MHVEKSKENKLIIIILIIALIALLVYLIIYLNNNKTTEVNKTITCTLETNEEGEETSEITFKSNGTKVTSLTFNYLYVYSDNAYALQLINEEEKINVESLNNIEGVTASINYDEAETLLEVKGSINYAKVKDVQDLTEPYKSYVKSYISEEDLTKYLTDQGYTCK